MTQRSTRAIGILLSIASALYVFMPADGQAATVLLTNAALTGSMGNSSNALVGPTGWTFLRTDSQTGALDASRYVVLGSTGSVDADSQPFNPHGGVTTIVGTVSEVAWDPYTIVTPVPPPHEAGWYQNIEASLGAAVGGSLVNGNTYEITVSMWVHDNGTDTAWRTNARENLGIGLANTNVISTAGVSANFGPTQSFWYVEDSADSPLGTGNMWTQWTRTYTVTHGASSNYYFFFGGLGIIGAQVTLPEVTVQDLSATLPEPSTWVLGLMGGGLLVACQFFRRRRVRG